MAPGAKKKKETKASKETAIITLSPSPQSVQEPARGNGSAMFPTASDLDSTWPFLEEGLKIVFQFSEPGTARLTMKTYMQYYTCVYDFCVNVTRDKKTENGVYGTGSRDYDSQAELNRSANGPPIQLAKKIGEFVRAHLVRTFQPDMSKHHGDDLLRYYTRKWQEFRFSARVAHGFCSYLNEHFLRRRIEQAADGSHADIFPIYGVCLQQWRDTALAFVQDQLLRAVADVVISDRDGNSGNSHMIRTVVDCLVDLGLTLDLEAHAGVPVATYTIPPSTNGSAPATNGVTSTTSSKSKGLTVYREYLEKPFLEDTRGYYRKESMDFLAHNSVAKYMEKVEARLKDEEGFCAKYLHETTWEVLRKTVEDVLITKHMPRLRAEFMIYLAEENIEYLRAMYALISRVPVCLDDLYGAVQTHVRQKGQEALKKNPTAVIEDPKQFVTSILEIHDHCLPLITTSFRNEKKFQEAFDKGFYTFVNDNAVTAIAKSSKKAAELFARYCDAMLKKGAKNLSEADLEETLTRFMIAFKFIEDKDVFQRYYQKCLCRRLISEQSASDDAEASMISKLKVVAGWEYVTKLQRMFQDMAISTETNTKFRESDTGGLQDWKFEFSVQVLASGSWPLSEGSKLLVPQEMERPLRLFRDYYVNHFSGRKLNWVFPNSRAEISTNGFEKKHVITVSATQAAILFAFNDATVRTIGELRAIIGFTERAPMVDAQYRQSLLVILKCKLLLMDKDGDKLEETDLTNEESEVRLNMIFKDKRLRFKLNLPLRAEQKQEEDRTDRGIDEDRTGHIQAAIVRIMKMRKELKHQPLIAEAVEHLALRFKPNIPAIKKNIEILIEKEYLRRSEEERELYIYIA